jgi:large subunit ribosomal protein L4e
MFAPTKTWRRWHRKVNSTQKRYAIVSALAASAVPALVMARGHRVEKVAEVPLVVSNDAVKGLQKTSAAVKLLKSLNAFDDVQKVKDSKKIRPGQGKARNRRYVQKRGPLVVFDQKTDLVRAFRNIPGVELASVNRLNILQLAPGGHVGRFVIYVQDAFQKLEQLYGSFTKKASLKSNYILPQGLLSNGDLARIINSDEIQSAVRPTAVRARRPVLKKNPLKNLGALIKLNPYAKTQRRKEILKSTLNQRRPDVVKKQKKAARDEKKRRNKALKKSRKAFYTTLLS